MIIFIMVSKWLVTGVVYGIGSARLDQAFLSLGGMSKIVP